MTLLFVPPSTNRTQITMLLLLTIGYFCVGVSSFGIVPAPAPPITPTRPITQFCRGGTLVGLPLSKSPDANEKTSSNKASLVFSGDLNFSSPPLPNGTSKADVASFLLKPEIRNSLLSSGGTREVEEVSGSPELSKLWIKFCDEEYGNENKPEPGDCMLACDSVIQFPGLKMINRVFNGAKCAIDPDSSLPTYSFFLIGEKQSVSGLPPVVFMFNKLTGAEKKGDSLEPTGVAKSTLTVKENSDGDMIFFFEAVITITIEFPALLLKILPTTKEKAEAQGSASVLKTISKAVEDSTQALYDDFLAQSKN